MKIALGSDLHLEFGSLAEVRNREGADALILSGDILVANHFRDPDYVWTRAPRYHEFFDQCEAEFGTVIYVMGNHEHYDGDFQCTLDILQQELAIYPGVHVLEKTTLAHTGVTFVGATLWTDLNRRDPVTMWEMQRRMNDYRCVTNGSGSRLLPQDTVEDHDWALAWIDQATQDTSGCYVVVGHHAPSRQSIKPRYATDHLMNGGYNSDLEEFIRARPQIRLWTHGHTHDDFDYTVGSTRVVCNPRGYVGHESRTEDWDFKYFQVEPI